MAETYNVYTSNLQEGIYTKIAERLTEPKTTINADDPVAGGVKYVKVAAVNDAGEGFLSKANKMTFIGKVPKPEILSYFRNGFFMNYRNAPYAASVSLQNSVNGVFRQVDSSQLASKFVMAEGVSQPTTIKAVGHAENSMRSSDAIPNIVPQSFNLACGVPSQGIRRSTDFGQTWNTVTLPSGGGTVQSCFAYCDNNIIMAGFIVTGNDRNGLARSTDGGITWNYLPIPPISYYSLIYLGNGVVLAATNIGIKRSTDSGLTWNSTSISSGIYQCLAYLGNNIVVAAGDSGIKRSIDGGVNWHNTSVVSGTYLSVVYLGNNVLLAGGNKSGMRRSTDGGINWGDANYPSETCYCFAYLGNNVVLASCYQETGSSGVIRRSTNGGISWGDTSLKFGGGALIQRMAYLGNNTVLTAGFAIFSGYGFGIYKSVDGGINWYLSSNTVAWGIC